jgi:hypothetical protein
MVAVLASAKEYRVSCASSLLSSHNTSSEVLLKKWNKDVECLLWPFSPQKYRLLAAYVEFLAGPKKKLHPRHMESLHYLKLHYGPGMVPVLAPEKRHKTSFSSNLLLSLYYASQSVTQKVNHITNMSALPPSLLKTVFQQYHVGVVADLKITPARWMCVRFLVFQSLVS